MAERQATIWTAGGVRLPLALLLAVAMLSTAGCRGCNSEDTAAKAAREAAEKLKREQEEKEKRLFEVEPPVVLPGQEDSPLNFVKPGHWVAASQKIQYNREDFVGYSYTSVVDDKGRDVPIANTRYQLRSTRPVVLSKERPKHIESLFLVPAVNHPVRMVRSLRERRSGVQAMPREQWPLLRLEPYQYLLVVLAAEANRYTYLKTVNAVKVPYDGLTELDDSEDPVHYQVVQPDVSKRIPLPDNPLAWTGIAYIVWDEVDPSLFTPEQEAALVDWIQWGGQLLVSGPDSLDLLAGSFLEAYLPARSGGSRTIATDDLAELSRRWLVTSRLAMQKPLAPLRPWSGVKLVIDERAHAVEGTGELLVERDVGRGRVAVSAMHLSEQELINWNPHFQNWLNACLLRHPPRRFQKGAYGDATLLWADADKADHRLDAQFTTGLRFFVRDVGVDTNYRHVQETEDWNGQSMAPIVRELPPEAVGGKAAWNDYSQSAKAARDALRQAAGVEVPNRSFVVWAVAIYLVVLVPLNWLFFQAIGRVEWAWIAAPLIALAATFFVVHQAQLDIGFVRAHTEVGILELQPEYPRGHLSRYSALYTSLATTYDLEFENLTTLAAPFPGGETNPLRRGERRSWVTFERHDATRLSDVQVTSNSTQMVHSEQMFPLDGAIALGTSSRGHRQVENGSQLDLSNVVVLRRSVDGRLAVEGTWIGPLRAGDSAAVSFQPLALSADEIPFADRSRAEAEPGSAARLDADALVRLAFDPAFLAPGEIRLVGRVDGVLAGETVSPAASQTKGATVVVAHLQYPDRPPPRPDLNAAIDVVDEMYRDQY